jgi:hypothetical protein
VAQLYGGRTVAAYNFVEFRKGFFKGIRIAVFHEFRRFNKQLIGAVILLD